MPTIPDFNENRNQLPEAPPATDIAPERFGRDAAALADFGGDLADLGGRLMSARKQAEDADAVSNAVADDTILYAQMEKEAQEAGPGPVNKGWSVRGEQPISMTDALVKKMGERLQEQTKAMPSEDARRRYESVTAQTIAETYARNLKWENRERTRLGLFNVGERARKLSLANYQNPTLDGALASLKALREDIEGHTGTYISPADAPKARLELGAGLVKSYFHGLADSSVEMSPEKRAATLELGRKILKSPPEEMKEFLNGDDVKTLSAKLDSAEREGKQNDSYREQLNKKAVEEIRDRQQNTILKDIYEGKGSIKKILESNLDPDKKQQMINVLNARLKEPRSPNQEALRKVVERIYADPEDPMKINSESQIINLYTRGGLTWEQKQHALNEFKGRYTMAGQVESEQKKLLYKQAASMLVTKDFMGKPVGQEEFSKYWSFVLGEIEAAKKEGRSTKELLDANSPKYLGNAIRSYQKSPAQLMKESAERLKSQAVQRQAQAARTAPQPKGTVLMVKPSGQRVYIPSENLEKAKARGYKEAK